MDSPVPIVVVTLITLSLLEPSTLGKPLTTAGVSSTNQSSNVKRGTVTVTIAEASAMHQSSLFLKITLLNPDTELK